MNTSYKQISRATSKLWSVDLEKGTQGEQHLIYFAMGQEMKMQIPEELKMLLVIQTWVGISFIRAAVILIKVNFLIQPSSSSTPAEVLQ